MKIDITLEWFLNPDHLPFIAGIELGWFAATIRSRPRDFGTRLPVTRQNR